MGPALTSSKGAHEVFEDDYPTPARSCVRDFVHVVDLAEAHVAAAERLEADIRRDGVYNIGRGLDVSMKELLAVARDGTGHPFDEEIAPRRAGARRW